MGVLDFEDSEATIEVVVFPKLWSRYKPLLNIGSLYFIKGQLKQDRGLSILADEIITEEDYKSLLTHHVTITIEADGLCEDFYCGLCRLLRKHPGKYEVLFKLVNSEQTIVSLLKSIKVDLNDSLCSELQTIPRAGLTVPEGRKKTRGESGCLRTTAKRALPAKTTSQ